ncbi:MAG: tetratricopeptide repeat protein [Verrucomicrobiota bacterium]|nr:tetratricopeptide repeat protein [Verrucomicrobiota bacterium]
MCIWSAIYDVQAIQLVALSWGIWHGMMQTYGFCRIYDSKASGAAAARARVDFYLCFAWFTAAVLVSPLRFRSCLELYYASGGPIVPAAAVQGLRMAIIVALAAVTAAFFWRHWRDFRSGRGGSQIKLALLASSIGFWWYCNNGVQNILVGIALFEVFHDVQYLSIVWIYNRSRVERDDSIKGFMRFVFRRSGSLLGVYVGLVLAYGSIALLTSQVSAEWIRQGLVGIVTASALLHFYYDGFIWKMRETQTRSMLNISGDGVNALNRRGLPLPTWFPHTLRWAALLIPFTALCASQLLGRVVPPLERTAKVVEVLPGDAQAQLNYGKALHEAGRVKEAVEHYQSAVKINPELAEAEMFLGLAFGDLGALDEAVQHYERALSLDPRDGKAECNLASVLAVQGRRDEARKRFEHSLSIQPDLFLAHKELGDLLVAAGEYDAAINHYTEALRIRPNFPEAQQNLDVVRSLLVR